MSSDRQYVIRACQMLKVDLLKPTRHAPGILATSWVNGFGHSVIDASTWGEARTQLDSWRMKRAGSQQ